MKTSAKIILLCGATLGLLILGLFLGCKDPESNPYIPPPPIRDGIPLDTNATHIAPSPTGKPWLVSSDWNIPAGRTVTIEPGTEIMFDQGLWWVTVDGQLVANGTPERPIVFTSGYIEPEMGQWRGLRFRNPDVASEIRYCIFTYGAYFDIDTISARGQDAQSYRGMLCIKDSSPIIEHCIVYRNQNNAIYLTGNRCAPRIRYNIFNQNDASAVRADSTVVDLDQLDISYNCVNDNSALPFIIYNDSTLFGVVVTVNDNLDSCDVFFNIDLPPLMKDPEHGDFSLRSCSPCIDAGPSGTDLDPYNTRTDLGIIPYRLGPGDLRGVLGGTLAGNRTYRMICNLRVRDGESLVIEPGVTILANDLYTFEVYGRLEVNGTPADPVTIQPCDTCPDLWGGPRFLNVDTLSRPSVLRHTRFVNYQHADVLKPGVRFEGCSFVGGFDYGLRIATKLIDFVDSVSVDQCTFENCGRFGISVDSSAATIRNTLVRNSKGRGITAHLVDEALEITNCVVHTCSTTAFYCENFSRPVLLNNVFANCGYYGVQMVNNSRPVIRNSIITGCGRYGVKVVLSSMPELDFNNVYDNSREDTLLAGLPPAAFDKNYNTTGPYPIPIGSSISANPLFRDQTGGDYHLQAIACGDPADSPSIDQGDFLLQDAALSCDLGLGTARCDQGAYGGPRGTGVGAPLFGPRHGRLALR